MLFNSYSFLFVFLPITYFLFYFVQLNKSSKSIIYFLFISSLFFYGYWNIKYLPILIGSILFNFTISMLMNKINNKIFYLGLTGNILLLIYFKYSQFLLENLALLLNYPIQLANGDLPLGVSFFTFTQIAYLADRYQKKLAHENFGNYGLFVTFFPHLMAGPILHHNEIMPQFKKRNNQFFNSENIAVGLTIFTIGLAKKSIIADSLAPYVNLLFDNTDVSKISSIEAWYASLAYSFQLYFDFSGYSDMAIGLARIFGIIFPLNFNSPYKSYNIINFWRRWHMTLSRFLRDYIYIPLGGNRKSNTRRHLNLMLTMLIGGLWHGAAWTFLFWGALHGTYLIINHFWHFIHKNYLNNSLLKLKGYSLFSQFLTFIAVVVAWVFFRSNTFEKSLNILSAMFKIKGNQVLQIYNNADIQTLTYLLIVYSLLIFLAPNTQQLLKPYKPAIEIYKGEIQPYPFKYILWKPNLVHAMFCALFTIFSLLSFGHISEFLYYKF